jgi:hypothetical protein
MEALPHGAFRSGLDAQHAETPEAADARQNSAGKTDDQPRADAERPPYLRPRAVGLVNRAAPARPHFLSARAETRGTQKRRNR